MNRFAVTEIVRQALDEDLAQGDITSEAIFDVDKPASGSFIAKSSGVIAGLPVVAEVFHQIDSAVMVTFAVSDGARVQPDALIATVKGPIKALLAGERVALNFLQRLSGVATQTAILADQVQDLSVRVVDTRKTTPGLRLLEKYAVRKGGGHNHRYNLADAVLIKDNHIAACGSVLEAILRARQNVPHTMKIEVEVENESQVREALEAGADIIMLDNMNPALMKEMVALINRRAIVEASGNITAATIREVALTGVDIISVGAITRSAPSLDISLDIEG